MEAERGFRQGGGAPGGGGYPAAAAAQGSIADNLPPSALASLVSKVFKDESILVQLPTERGGSSFARF